MTRSNALDTGPAKTGDTVLRLPRASYLGAARVFAGAPTDVFRYLPRLAARYGDIVNLPVPGMTVTLLSHPDYVGHVFVKKSLQYHKVAAASELTAGEPLALSLLEGDEWKRVRRTFSPFFAEQALANVTQDHARLGRSADGPLAPACRRGRLLRPRARAGFGGDVGAAAVDVPLQRRHRAGRSMGPSLH